MKEDLEQGVGPASQLAPETDPEILLYDYSKYLLTLSMLILGGVLTISQTSDVASRPPAAPLLVVVICIAGSGFLSLSCTTAIVRSRLSGKPQNRAVLLNQLSMGLLGAGVGAFLTIWIVQLL